MQISYSHCEVLKFNKIHVLAKKKIFKNSFDDSFMNENNSLLKKRRKKINKFNGLRILKMRDDILSSRHTE